MDEVTLTPLVDPAADARTESEAKGRGGKTAPRPMDTVRVDAERLDQLMDLAGQLVINKARFSRIGEALKTVLDGNQSIHALNRVSAELDKLGGRDEARSAERGAGMEVQSLRATVAADPERPGAASPRSPVVPAGPRRRSRDLFEAIHQLERVSDGIQQSVMDIRMVPIGPLFSALQSRGPRHHPRRRTSRSGWRSAARRPNSTSG